MEDKFNNSQRPNIATYQDANSLRENQPYFVNLTTLEKLALQTVPNELEYDPKSSFASIEIPGRNTPFYHFTGAEDVLQFTISWYANHESRNDVLAKCKWIEALSKVDGYTRKNPEVLFIMGELFSQTKWIVASAQYKMGLFDRTHNMMPRIANQVIILNRISEVNTRWEDLLKLQY